MKDDKRDNITQSEIRRPKTRGDRDAEEQGALLHDRSDSSLGEGRTIRYFSMFSGVGGFELGLENARSKSNISERRNENTRSSSDLFDRRNQPSNETKYQCVGFSEIDKYSIQTYLKNFPDHTNFGDATKIDPRELPDFDMLCGGFPCQSFSIAGKRKGFDDTRGTMFFEIARILEVKRPRIVFLENVKGLLNHGQGATFKRITQTLEELGYDVQWMVLNSKFFGVPQNRERVFIIGSLRGTGRPEILPFRSSSEEIDKQQSRFSFPTVFSSQHKIAGGMPMIADSVLVVGTLDSDGWEKRHEQIRRVHSVEGISPTIPTGTGGGVMTKLQEQSMRIRRLTPTECERLQGFPDGWTEGVSDTQRYKQMGNAVTVNVIRAIGERL